MEEAHDSLPAVVCQPKFALPLKYCQFFDMASNQASSRGPGGDKATGGADQKKKKESIVDLSKYLDKRIRVKFQGGREVNGVLKGYDPLLNLVLDNAFEFMRDPDDPLRVTDETRSLGLTVCRGTAVLVVCPVDGFESIPNPFIQQE